MIKTIVSWMCDGCGHEQPHPETAIKSGWLAVSVTPINTMHFCRACREQIKAAMFTNHAVDIEI